MMCVKTGFIYKVTNKINNKIYIGKIERTIEARWTEHLYYSNKIKNKFYNAISKYGKDNFIIEIIEIAPVAKLNEREQYWIKYYNSFIEGYNSTWGGEGHSNVKITIEDILPYWLETYNIKTISQHFHCENETIIRILKENGQYLTQEQLDNVAMLDSDHNLIQVFINKQTAAKWLIANNKTTSTQTSALITAIRRSINTGIKAYGYYWKPYGPQKTKRKYSTGLIFQVDDDNNIVQIYSSVKSAAEAFGSSHTNISAVLNTGLKRLGYKWETEEHYHL